MLLFGSIEPCKEDAVRALLVLTVASLAAWIGLLAGRGLFWWPTPRLEPSEKDRAAMSGGRPSVVAVIPARNEADVLGSTLPTVLAQDYDGPFRAVLVDDRSDDGTADAARAAAAGRTAERLAVLSGEPLPEGWSGKVWAMHQGVTGPTDAPDYFWLTDADIAHEPWVLSALVSKAETDDRDLVSTMATLRVESGWDRLLVPAFVYFFAKLYPFRFVNASRRRSAGAAGGCVLVRRHALERAGGLAAMHSALIDDCALARRVKAAGGRLWLGFCSGVRSVRRYGTLASVWGMVARSAYAQLGHSPLVLAGTVLGMLFLYALAPAASIAGIVAAGFGVQGALVMTAVGVGTWGLISASFLPVLQHHGVSWRAAPLLPLAGVLYTAMTVSSAHRHAVGRGTSWKGRTY